MWKALSERSRVHDVAALCGQTPLGSTGTCQFGCFPDVLFPMCAFIKTKKKKDEYAWVTTWGSLWGAVLLPFCFLQRGNTLKALSATRPKTNLKKEDQIGKMSLHERGEKQRVILKSWVYFLAFDCFSFYVSGSPFVSTFSVCWFLCLVSSSTEGCKREIVHHIPHVLWW